MDPTLLAILSIFGGAALTAVAGLVGSSIQSGREHRRWIRERRMEAYERVHRLVEEMRYGDRDLQVLKEARKEAAEIADKAGLQGVEREELLARVTDGLGGKTLGTPKAHYTWTRSIVARKVEAEASLALVGPAAVRARLEDVFGALADHDTKSYAAAIEKLEAAMRTALAVDDY